MTYCDEAGLFQILENTPEHHVDHSSLKLALERAEELCSQVNEGVREKENSDRLEWIQAHVQCEGLAEVRPWCAAGRHQAGWGGEPGAGLPLVWTVCASAQPVCTHHPAPWLPSSFLVKRDLICRF